jgi:hypothetical protein
MTPKTLFTIVLKVLGIFFIRDMLSLIPQLLNFISYWLRPHPLDSAFVNVCMILFLILIHTFICYCLIFKTDLLIDKLNLSETFNQEAIPLNIHRSTVLSISIIILGGLILAQEVPNFLRLLYVYFQERTLLQGEINPATGQLIVAGTKIVFGLVLVGNQKMIVDYIERKRKK